MRYDIIMDGIRVEKEVRIEQVGSYLKGFFDLAKKCTDAGYFSLDSVTFTVTESKEDEDDE